MGLDPAKTGSAILCTITSITHLVGHRRWLLRKMLLDTLDILSAIKIEHRAHTWEPCTDVYLYGILCYLDATRVKKMRDIFA